MGQRRPAGIALAALALVSACTTEPVVTSVTVTPASVTLDAIGATQQFTAHVTAQDGRPLPAATVTWESSSPAATVDASGLVTAVGNGTAQITATANGADGSASVLIAQRVSALAKTGGDEQTGEVGTALSAALSVRADDRLGNPVVGVNVAFAVSAGGGSVSNGSVVTPAAGTASTSWTMGQVAGAPQTVTASAQGQTATFSATATRGPADSLVKVSGDNQFATADSPVAQPLVVRVADRFGNPVSGHAVAWSASGDASVNPPNTTTGANGETSTQLTLGSTPGIPYTVQATAAVVTTGSPATFTGTALTGTVTIVEGNSQTGLVGNGVNVAPAIRVVDGSGNPLTGLAVTFAVTGGGGSVTGNAQVTNTSGEARVGKWTLGSSAGTNTLTATVPGPGFAGNPAQFTATGAISSFDIELRYLGTPPSAAVQTAFNDARDRWQQLVFGDVPNVTLNAAAGSCGSNSPVINNETIDDLAIFVTVDSIDGPGGTLGQAGPCYVRNSDSLPIVGRMTFDEDDLANMETNGTLGDVILHEMGHVLGFGTLWNTFGFLQNPSCPGDPCLAGGTEDTHFDGPKAIAAFDAIGGTSYTGGARVPVENEQGGQGTRDSHWRESTFNHELMTGFIEAPGTANPLSRLTVASLWDFGYSVNLDGADPYTQVFTGPALAARPAGGKILLNDVAPGPIYVVGPDGRVVRVLRY